MGIITVNIVVNNIGSDCGLFDIYDDYVGLLATNISRQDLSTGVSLDVNDNATEITVVSKGICNNNIIVPITTFPLSPTPSPTPSVSITRTPSVTPSISLTPSQTPTVTPSISISPSIIVTRTPSVTPSNSVTPSITPSISISVTPSITPTVTVSTTPSISISMTPSITPTVTVSTTPSISISVTPSITPTRTPSPSPIDCSVTGGSATWIPPLTTPSPSPSATPSVTPSISITPSVTPSISISRTPSVTPSISISRTPSISITPTTTPSPTTPPQCVRLTIGEVQEEPGCPPPNPVENQYREVTVTLYDPTDTFPVNATETITVVINVLTDGSPDPVTLFINPGSSSSSDIIYTRVFNDCINRGDITTRQILGISSISPSTYIECAGPGPSPSPTRTPSVTPSISISRTPSVTPSITPSVSTSSGSPTATVNWEFYNNTGGGCWFSEFEIFNGGVGEVYATSTNTGTFQADTGLNLQAVTTNTFGCSPEEQGSSEVYYYLNGSFVSGQTAVSPDSASITVSTVSSGNIYLFIGYTYPFV